MRKKFLTNAYAASAVERESETESEEEDDDAETDTALSAYNMYMKEVVMELIRKADSTYDVDSNVDRISDVIDIVIAISKKIYTFIEMAENASKTEDRDGNLSDLVYTTVRDLQNAINENTTVSTEYQHVIERYFKLLLNGIPEASFDINSDVVLTSDGDILYMENVVKMIHETKAIHLEAFLWWSVVEELILYTTSGMRRLYHEYTKTITGVEGILSRSSYCTTATNKLMGYAVSHLIVEKNFMLDTKPRVEAMLWNIKREFNNLIYHNWMDWSTKERSLKKSEKMKSLIGFPEWILNKTELDMHYKGVSETFENLQIFYFYLSHFSFLTDNKIKIKGDTWMENVVALSSWQFMDKLTKFRMSNDIEWASSPSNVNAFHTFQANAISELNCDCVYYYHYFN
jgi:predicted metalloendopeptidase